MNAAPPNIHPPKGHEVLGRTLLNFGKYRKQWSVLHGASRFLMAGPGLLLLWFVADVLIKLPAWPLVLSFAAIATFSLWALAWWVIKPQFRSIDVEHEAYVIESLHGKLDNQIIGSLQLGREVANAQPGARLGYSTDFVSELLLRTSATLEKLVVRDLLDLRRERRAVVVAGLIVLIWLSCIFFAQSALKERMERLQDGYAFILDSLFPVELRVTPGDVAVIRGRSVNLAVNIPDARRREVTLSRINPVTNEVISEKLSLENNQAERIVENAQESFNYYFEYGNRKSSAFKVLVGDLPDVKTINYEMAFPVYTGQPTRTLTGRVPKLRGLSGTNVLVSFAATTDLHPDLSYVEWQDGTKQSIQFSGRFGHFSFPITRPDRATICLTSALAKPPHEKEWRMEQPISFSVDVQRDELPTVQILLKTKKMTMFAEQAAIFGFEWLAEDDFGVADVTMEYRIEAIDELLGRKPRQDSQSRLIEPPRERVKGKFNDMFKTLNPPLEPGDRITITVSVKDNNTETGPGGSRSTPIEIVVVRPDLDAFVEQQFRFGAQSPMGEMVKIKRVTDLLVDPTKTVRTEAVQKIEKKDVKTLAKQESWPSGAEDATGDYFRLLSGEK